MRLPQWIYFFYWFYGSLNIKFSWSVGVSIGISNLTCVLFWCSVYVTISSHIIKLIWWRKFKEWVKISKLNPIQDLFFHFRISDLLRLRRLQRMLPAAAGATEATTGTAAGASASAMPLPSQLSSVAAAPPAGPFRFNGVGGGRLLPMLHHQRLVNHNCLF